MSKCSGIYKIQSISKPERVYIGSALNIDKRWKEHIWQLKNERHHSQKLQRHYNKYGVSDLQFSIIAFCDKDNLMSMEQFYLDSIKTYFNNFLSANSPLGYKHTEEAKRKISEYNKRNGVIPPSPKGRVVKDTTKKKLKEAQLKRWEKPGERERMSKMRKGVKTGKVTGGSFTKGHKTWNKGKPNSEEAKRKMKEAWVIRRQRKAA
jgi:group I intron endonuclease